MKGNDVPEILSLPAIATLSWPSSLVEYSFVNSSGYPVMRRPEVIRTVFCQRENCTDVEDHFCVREGHLCFVELHSLSIEDAKQL
jgi:hypothetical protein